jgi:ketosteroid isomerase-like protein
MTSSKTPSNLTARTGEVFVRPPTLQPRADADTLARNASAARRFVEQVLGAGDMAAFDELVADDVWVSTGLQPDAPVIGKQAYQQVLGGTLGVALSNGSMTVHEVLPTLDGAVIVRFTALADHTGALDGIAATGQRLTLSETHLMRFREGRLIENYVGALNPLHWEMLYAPVIAARVVG